jgi:hypothetical protein
MSAWSWAIVSTAAFLLLAVVASFALAILSHIGQEVSELLQAELWAPNRD